MFNILYSLFTIHLSNLKFFSFHGVHEEEKVLGGEYLVNADIGFDADFPVTTLEQTIDYSKTYAIIKQRMAQPTALLETVAQDLAHQFYIYDNRIKTVTVCITKINPPILQFRGSVAVRYQKDF